MCDCMHVDKRMKKGSPNGSRLEGRMRDMYIQCIKQLYILASQLYRAPLR